MILILLLILSIYYTNAQYIYGNEVKTVNNNEIAPTQIDLMLLDITEMVKTYDEIKYNYTQLQLFDNGIDILNSNIYLGINFIENTIENKKILSNEYEKDYFDNIINSINPINMLVSNIQNRYNENIIKTKTNTNLIINFDYLDYEDVVLNQYLTDNEIKEIKLKLYFTKSNINYALAKKNELTNKLKTYNPDIYNNYIRSINNLYWTKRKLEQKN